MRFHQFLFAAFVFLSANSTATAAPDRFEPVRTYTRAQLAERSIPSVAVAVVKGGRIIWEEGFGWADRERRIRADAHTMYSIASISKPLTATGLMTLAQAGKLDLDKPANDYLGVAKLKARVGDERKATVRTIANHTAGLPLHHQFFYADEPYLAPTRDETILRYGNLVTPPGERSEYSNLGYGVLDYIIERVSGRSYADFMRQEVFLPLGMTHSSVGIGPGLDGYAAARYSEDGTRLPHYEFDHHGGSAIYASAHDLARFALFHMKERLSDQKAILTDASIDAMHPKDSEDYALGFSGARKNGYRLFGHSGGMAGVATKTWMFPDQDLAIVVLSNASDELPTEVLNRIAALFLPDWKAAPPEAPPETKPFVPLAEMVGTWQGTLATYPRDVPVQLVFRPDGGVHAKFGDQLTALVNNPHIEDGAFIGELRSTIGTPDTERYEYTVWLSLRMGGPKLTGVAIAVGENVPRVRNALSHWVALEKVP